MTLRRTQKRKINTSIISKFYKANLSRQAPENVVSIQILTSTKH